MRILITIVLIYSFFGLAAQDLNYSHKIIADLSDSAMHGRGYINKGELKAAKYIRKELKESNVLALHSGYFQNFRIDINTLGGNAIVSIDDRELKPFTDFLVSASTPSVHGKYDLDFISDSLSEKQIVEYLQQTNLKNKVLVTSNQDLIYADLSPLNIAAIVYRNPNKLYWKYSDGRSVAAYPILEIKEDLISNNKKQIYLNIESKFKSNYRTQNVIGFIPGKIQADSFYVFTAHYDHLGYMGENTLFPGANDNGSGIAMLLNLAKHYAQPENQSDYSIAFIALSAEESGLLGSQYYTSNPAFPLESIKFLINLDMIGSGSDGITLVNAKANQKAFDHFVRINENKNYLSSIKARGEAANSDHHFFHANGVPAVFIYTRGKEHQEYHTPFDTADKVPLTKFAALFHLLTDFIEQY
ncbi:MAG: DUF4910 domain-containing protein [Bacteroidales bacterium]|nr:DUF4910 domain-containing protein [Bacteroidales bacterium]